MNRKMILAACLIAFGATWRLIPYGDLHPPNLTPVTAIALFAGACFTDRRLAFGIPLATMLLSDAAMSIRDYRFGFHEMIPLVYGTYAVIVCLGFWLQGRRQALPIAAATALSSVFFFLVTNFGSWLLGESYYPHTFSGLVECYVKAIPFFRTALLGDVIWSTVFFGGYALAESYLRSRESKAATTA